MTKILLPKSITTGKSEVAVDGSLVVVGANGSGKSRLGAWLHSQSSNNAHRISAQRFLTVHNPIQNFGTREIEVNLKAEVPVSQPVDDFGYALRALTLSHIKALTESRRQSRSANIDDTVLEQAERLWNQIMPHRTIKIDESVLVEHSANSTYNGSDLSDGEKVSLYLIARVLTAPNHCTLIVDEPEIHLHQALQSVLWDTLESARPDCTFVYLSHDLGFASSRNRAKLIWIKSYDGNELWNWEEVEKTDGLPLELQLKILGNRKPVVLVEGTDSSYDAEIFRMLYPNSLVVAVGSADQVKRAAAVLNETPMLQQFKAIGIIDLDYRPDDEVAGLKEYIRPLQVAEIENLMLLPGVIEGVSSQLKRDPAEVLVSVQSFLFDALSKELEIQVYERSLFQINYKLNTFGGFSNKSCSDDEFAEAFEKWLGQIDATAIRAQSRSLYKQAIEDRDYSKLLKIYNRKSLAARISELLRLGKNEYPNLVLRLLQSGNEKIRESMLAAVPTPPAS